MEKNRMQSILIVDDSPANLNILGKALVENYRLKVTTNGKDALSIARSPSPPDLILLDIMMPEMDGYEVCKKLKEDPETRDIPIIFITAMDSEQNEEYGLSLGAIDYVTKPFSVPIVKARVKNHMELKRYRDILKESSMVDGLTLIANRKRLDEGLRAEFDRARRLGSRLSFLMVDIDNFKAYNDTYGHLEGDKCLCLVAQALKDSLKRPADLVARFGGEEFGCVLPDTALEGALSLAEHMRKAVEDLAIPHETSAVSEVITVSIGVASFVPSGTDVCDDIVQMADTALYKAKSTGRNRICSQNDIKSGK